jgi:hypothetical protein
MDLKNLLSDQFLLLLSDQKYIIPMDLELYIQDETGYCRDYCPITGRDLETQLVWLKWILDRPQYQ